MTDGKAKPEGGVAGADSAGSPFFGGGGNAIVAASGPAASPSVGSCRFCWWRALAGLRNQLSRRGFLLSALPASLWLALFYGFVLHVRLSLGGWPPFGQVLEDTLLRWHEAAVRHLGMGLLLSLYALPVVMAVLLILPRWRHAVVYLLTHAMAVAAAFGCVFLAPGPFLNWFSD